MIKENKNIIILKVLIWGFPLIFLLHDLEEIFTFEGFIKSRLTGYDLPGPILNFVDLTTAEFLVAVIFIFALTILVSYIGSRGKGNQVNLFIFLVGISILLINSITHVAQALIFYSYVPGLVTAIILVLPYTIYTLNKFRLDYQLDRRHLVFLLMAGLLLQMPLVVIALTIGKLLV